MISNDNHFESDHDSLTRKQYRELHGKGDLYDDPVNDFDSSGFDDEPSLSRQKLKQDQDLFDAQTKQQIAEQKSKKLAHRLDGLIALFTIGIIIVFLVLFFVN
ncbi:hypothetical protein [Nicoliella lavandulae]|uniref:Uncharacterized protein n=1 Tax=Nicoliella lavandulae TaxID=3082954 RepID=A0ABU8SLK9_9LACO